MAGQETAAALPELAYTQSKNVPTLKSRAATSDAPWPQISLALMVMCSVAYFFATVKISGKSPLWMDEVMAAWLSLLPIKMISPALAHGVMASPPTYFYLLKAIRFLFGNSNLALRLPSIAGGYTVGMAVFFLTRRRFALPFATLAMALSLETGILTYSTQVREYTLVTALFAVALLLWDKRREETFETWRAASIAVLLAACIALHFYGVLLAAALALMELLWAVANGRIRARVWAGIVVAGGSLLAWYPLMRRIMSFTAHFAASKHYFAQPSIPRLITAYQNVAFGGKGLTLACCLLAMISFVFFWSKIYGVPVFTDRFERIPAARSANLEIIVLGTVAVPLLVFLFAAVVTGTFNDRYAIAGTIGFAMLAGMLVSYLRAGAAVSCALLAASTFLLAITPKHATPADPYGIESLSLTGSNDPIVVGEGLAFLELQGEANAGLRNRLVYLTTPPGESNPDITNEELVKQWKVFHPDLDVEAPADFLGQHGHFYVLHSNQTTDVITPWLVRSGRLKVAANQPEDKDNRNVWLFESIPGASH